MFQREGREERREDTHTTHTQDTGRTRKRQESTRKCEVNARERVWVSAVGECVCAWVSWAVRAVVVVMWCVEGEGCVEVVVVVLLS